MSKTMLCVSQPFFSAHQTTLLFTVTVIKYTLYAHHRLAPFTSKNKKILMIININTTRNVQVSIFDVIVVE